MFDAACGDVEPDRLCLSKLHNSTYENFVCDFFGKSTIISVCGIRLAKRFSFIPCHFHTRKRMRIQIDRSRTNKVAVRTYLENKLVAQRELKRLRAKAGEDPDQKSGPNAPDES